MSAAVSFCAGLRTARSTDIKNFLDADASPGYFRFYTAPRPATGAALSTQTLLGTCVLSHPCGTVSNGVLTFSAIADDDAADATGTASWLRGFDGAGNFVLDMDVSDTSGNAPFKLTSTAILMGGKITVASGTITEGNA